MLRFRFVLIAAAFLAAAPLFVEAQTPDAATGSSKVTTVPFRVGTVYSAEISALKPDFDGDYPFDPPVVENPAWVEVVVKLGEGRSISRFDYEIIGKRTAPYPCFAVAEKNDPYSLNPDKWVIKKANSVNFYRLLFPVEQSEFSGGKDLLTMTLKLKLFETALDPSEIKVRVMPNDHGFTGVGIPAQGICNMTFSELTPELQRRSAKGW